MATISVAESEEPLVMVASSCSSSVAAVTEELNKPSQWERHSQVEQNSKSTSAIITEESSNSNATNKSDDSSILAVFDNSFTFYDRWNHEVHVLRATIDEKIGLLAEQSQREVERIAAQMTGYQIPHMKRQSAASKYKITDLGPKVPPQQRIPRDVLPRDANTDRKAIDDQNPLGTVPSSPIEPRLERVLSQLSSSQVVITASPSGRSHATGTSDKTVPQSNLSKHKHKKQPTSIRQVMSIPEESSLPNESDGGEDQRPYPENNTSAIMSPSLEEEEEDMDEFKQNDDDLMFRSPHHSNDDDYMDDHSERMSHERRIRGLSIITSHSEFLGDDETKPMMTSIPALPLSSTSFPSYESKASPTPQAKSPPKPFYRFFDTIRELRSTRQHRPWYQTSRDAPTLVSPRPDAPSEEKKAARAETEPVTAVESSSKVETIPTSNFVAIDDSPVTKSPSIISSSKSPTSALSDISPTISKSEADLVNLQPPPIAEEGPNTKSMGASLESSSVPEISETVAAPPPKRRKSPPLPEIFQLRRSTEKLPRRSIKVDPEELEPPVEGATIAEENQEPEISVADNIEAETNDEKEIAAPCLDIVVYNQERKVIPRRENIDASVLRMEYVTDRVIQDPYDDEGTYTGILIRGKPDSHGSMVYKDGRTYSGSWKRGSWTACSHPAGRQSGFVMRPV